MHYQTVEPWGSYMPPVELIQRLAGVSAVVIFSESSCCMCHAIKGLFRGMGVNATVYELDEHPRGKDIEKDLMMLLAAGTSSSSSSTSSHASLPLVFIGGKFVGAMDMVMASHINGTLVPLLKEAGALWL